MDWGDAQIYSFAAMQQGAGSARREHPDGNQASQWEQGLTDSAEILTFNRLTPEDSGVSRLDLV
jgi:hypothetical protein